MIITNKSLSGVQDLAEIKVLLAGGETELLAEVKECLVDFSRSVELAESPRDCMTRLKSGDTDVVLIDQTILSKDPGQALGFIRASAPRSAILCLVPDASEEEALALIRLGADEVVTRQELREGKLNRIVGRVWQRSNAGVQMTSQISDFVLTHSFDGILTLDLQNRVLLWNHAMERMFGRKREDVLGKVAVDVLPFEGLGGEIARAVSGLSFAGQTRRYLLRGVMRVYRPYYSPLTSRSGQVIGAMAIFRDMTEELSAGQQIKELKERVDKLADTVPKMVWMAGVDGVRNYFNSRWADFTGVNVEALANDGWLVGVHPQDRPNYVAVLRKALDDRENFHVEYRMRRHDNSFRRILDSGTPLMGPDKEFLGFIGTCTDISETGTTQHRIETRQLARLWSETGDYQPRSMRETAASTMEDAPIGVWKLDRDLVITKASRAVADQLGVEPSHLVGLPFVEVVGSIPRESLESVLTEQTTVQLTAHRVDLGQGDDKKSVLWDLAAWPLKDKSKAVIGVCVSTIEVDEKSSNDKLKEDFIATLVHDLKTPLIGADRTLELMIGGALGEVDSGQSEVLSMLRRSNQGLLRMVQNLIEVYRYDFSKADLASDSISLFDIATECSRELAAVAEQKGVNLETSLSAGHGLVLGDALAVKRVFLNLLDNAIKFTQAGGKVRLWGEETPNQVTVYVKDSGIGIDREDLGKVFERFWRSEKGRGQAVGTGLGLYLCKQIVDAHSGEIKVDSEPGVGTVFSIMLPKR